jgi:hypothetical protein
LRPSTPGNLADSLKAVELTEKIKFTKEQSRLKYRCESLSILYKCQGNLDSPIEDCIDTLTQIIVILRDMSEQVLDEESGQPKSKEQRKWESSNISQ